MPIADNMLVIDKKNNKKSQRIMPIEVNGGRVGTLVLNNKNEIRDLLVNRIIRRQGFMLLLVALVGSLLAILASALFARGLTAPLREIQRATAKIAQREFRQRAVVDTRDELATLANGINEMAESLWQYEARQKQWLEDIAHELRTPIMVVMGELEAMVDGVSEATPDNIAARRRDMEQLMRLVNDLGELARLEGDAFECVCDCVDLKASLQSAAQRFSQRLNEANLNLVIEMADDIVVSADAERLQQVWSNILENAIRYVDRPGKLILSAASKGYHVEVCYDDTGPGVPEAALPRLFDRLYRVESSRNRALGGAGLGLSLCALIMKKQGGDIVAEKSAQGGLGLRLKFLVLRNNNS